MTCLIVDDSDLMRRIYRNAVKDFCDEILEASDGRAALELLDPRVSLLIADWNMPELGGLELVRQVRANPVTAKVRILMVSARSGRQDVMDAIQAGVNGYVVKPFAIDALRRKVEELLAAARAELPVDPASGEGTESADGVGETPAAAA
jgi:two-component system chemotaxis response regulator CheY